MPLDILRSVFGLPDDGPLCSALSVLACADLMDAARYPGEDVGWSQLTTQVATLLRELDQEHGMYDEEPALIRGILDGSWHSTDLSDG